MPDQKKRAAVLGLAVLALSGSPVQASGGVSCEAHDTAVKFDVLGDVARAVGATVGSVQGTLDVKDKAGRWQSVAVQGSLVQSWIEGRDVKLQFYVEKSGFNSGDNLELVISTRRVGSTDQFKGKYILRNYGHTPDAKITSTFGQAVCSLD